MFPCFIQWEPCLQCVTRHEIVNSFFRKKNKEKYICTLRRASVSYIIIYIIVLSISTMWNRTLDPQQVTNRATGHFQPCFPASRPVSRPVFASKDETDCMPLLSDVFMHSPWCDWRFGDLLSAVVPKLNVHGSSGNVRLLSMFSMMLPSSWSSGKVSEKSFFSLSL